MFISVLNADMGLPFWKAVQWGSTLQSVQNNPFYTSGINMNMPKNAGDINHGQKQITEIITQTTATAHIIEIPTATNNLFRIATNRASKKIIHETSQN